MPPSYCRTLGLKRNTTVSSNFIIPPNIMHAKHVNNAYNLWHFVDLNRKYGTVILESPYTKGNIKYNCENESTSFSKERMKKRTHSRNSNHTHPVASTNPTNHVDSNSMAESQKQTMYQKLNIEPERLINGIQVASRIKQRLKEDIKKWDSVLHSRPGLAMILVGNREDSTKYVTSKKKTAEEIGMNSYIFRFEENVTDADVLEKIKELNANENVHGIVVQLPLPSSLNKKLILDSIHPLKDVDGFQTNNSATALAVMDLLDSKGIKIEGKNAVIIGRSSLVGKPIAERLLERNATITICHSKTPIEEIKTAAQKADIIVSACGVPRLVKKDFLRPGCVIIDVGITKEGNSVVGDVDFENCKSLCCAITPVPGGVGPMTVCKLMDMTMIAFKRLHHIPNEEP